MEPAVPFALLGSATLLCVAAWVALAGAAVVGRRGRAVPVLLAVAGSLVLAAVDTRTALRAEPASDLIAVTRAAALLLLAAGLYAGALARAPRRPALLPSAIPVASPAVVVPLAAAPGPAALAAAAAVAAALAALRPGRDLAALLLAAGLLATGVGSALGPVADGSSTAATGVLVARAAGAALLLAGLVVLARASLLAKVVAAILAGALATAAAAVGVVGSTVASAFDREQAALVRDAAAGRLQLLQRVLDRNAALTSVVAGACTQRPESCDGVLARLGDTASSFALLVQADGTPQVLAGADSLSAAEAVGLAGSSTVARALAGGPGVVATVLPAQVRLSGTEPGLALVVVAPQGRPTPDAPATSAFVYGTRVDDRLVGEDIGEGGFGLSVLVGDRVVASNLTAGDRERLRRIVAGEPRADSPPPSGLTIPAEGQSPTVHLSPVVRGGDEEVVATLALSRDASQALRAQRETLRALLLTALATTALVGGLAVLLGRRTVQPVRRLTAAAQRVTAGDLEATAGQSGPDEIGTLSRAFDTMTGSLARATGDLQASNARLETVLASMSDGLVATDRDGRVTSINRAALAMAGLELGDALHAPLDGVLDVRDAGGTRLALPAGLPSGGAAEVHAADGTATPVQVGVAPLASGEGAVLVLRDTTREREVERMKTEFLSNVSHELRTPLTPIRGYADLLASRPGLTPEQVATFAGTILAESLKMNRVVDLLVDVAAIEAGRVQTSPQAVSARALLDSRIELWRARAPERAADLRRRAASGLPPVLVDPAWVGKALDELVDNAVKHTPPGTRITLAAGRSPDGDGVRVSVRDNGPGIAPADQDALLSSFAQVDGSATRRVGGLGLGLSFVRRLAEEAGYRLTVTSELGKGTELALDLPAAQASATGPASPAGPRRGRARGSAR